MSSAQSAPPGSPDLAYSEVPLLITKMLREAHAHEEQVEYDKWEAESENDDLAEMDWY